MGKADELVLKSRRVLTPADGERPASVHIADGVIRSIGPYESEGEDLGELVLMPGLVDTHVHINDPRPLEKGRWEGFDTATAAAAAGGITTLLDMPLNSLPVTTSVESMRKKIAAASGRCRVDVGLLAGLVAGNADQIGPVLDAGAVGVKAFLCHSGLDEFPAVMETDLRAAMPVIARHGSILMVHAELVDRQRPIANVRRYSDYLGSRPDEFELDAIRMMIRLCAETGCRVHIVHLSSAQALPMLSDARLRRGLPITVETCPHYLCFCAEEIGDGQTLFKCAPPIRSKANREELWSALRRGEIDMIVSDHSPCPPELKHLATGDFRGAWGGVASLQLGLSIVWTEAARRGFAVADVARWMSRKPAELAGLGNGIAPGSSADLFVFDPDATITVDPNKLFHHHKLTPYAGRTLRGVVIRTYLRGKLIYDGGRLVGVPSGKIISRTS